MKTTLVVSSGQYETVAVTVTVNHKTFAGLCRRITQLEREYTMYGGNWAGWIPAKVALASDDDEWRDNSIAGGRRCRPANGWLTTERHSDGPHMTYEELRAKIGAE
jgi:hypothetical protein